MGKNDKIYLLKDFEDWIELQSFKNKRSGKCVVSRLKKLNEYFLNAIQTGDFEKDKKTKEPYEKSIWDIYKDIMEDSHGPKWDFLEELNVAIMSCINDNAKKIVDERGVTQGTVKNYSSAFSTYTMFIESCAQLLNMREDKELTTNELATIANITKSKITLTREQLIAVFASRMNTQNRCSGEKVFLPMGLIGKVLRKADKNMKVSLGSILEWSRNEAKKVKLHVENGTVPILKISKLIIDTYSGEVTLVMNDGETSMRVFDPVVNGKKEPMYIYRISHADIDHEVEIDTILKQNGVKLQGLRMLTDWIKKAQEEMKFEKIDKDNIKEIFNRIEEWNDFEELTDKNLINNIIDDLELISKEEKLQLASGKWNKSTKKQANKLI